MNKHTTPVAAQSPATPPPATNGLTSRASHYDWRTEPCACDGGHVHGYSQYGPTTGYCEDCGATGMVAAQCVECSGFDPLNDDGECQKCNDAHELPLAAFAAKYHPRVQL